MFAHILNLTRNTHARGTARADRALLKFYSSFLVNTHTLAYKVIVSINGIRLDVTMFIYNKLFLDRTNYQVSSNTFDLSLKTTEKADVEIKP